MLCENCGALDADMYCVFNNKPFYVCDELCLETYLEDARVASKSEAFQVNHDSEGQY